MSEVEELHPFVIPSVANDVSEVEGRPQRLFIGVDVDDVARTHCAEVAAQLERAGLHASYVDPANYHLTLLFLGNVTHDRVAAIGDALASLAPRHAAFSLTFDRVGAFPHERKPRVIFAGTRGADSPYRALAGDVRDVFETLGFASDDDAVPHVTLARVSEKKRAPMPLVDVTPFPMHVTAVTLFESVPHEGRTRYVKRSVFLLR